MPVTRGDISPLKRHIEESPKLRELRGKRAKKRKRMAILLSILFLTLVGAFIDVARHPRLQLTIVVVSGNKVIDTDDVTGDVEKFLQGNYAYVIPHRNAFFYPKKKIVAALTDAFPRFKKVAVYRTDFNTLFIDVEEVRGHALWCGLETVSPDLTSQCYFTDETGKIVAPSPYYSGNVYPRFFGGSFGKDDVTPIGKSFVTEAEFNNLLSFEEQVNHLGLTVRAITVGGSEDSFLIDIGSGKTASLRFLSGDNYSVLASNLTAALGKDELKNTLKTDKSNLQYFDLRFTNKVYYKFSDK